MQLEEPTPTAETPMKEVRVTLADVEDIPSGELRIVESPKYEVRKLGKPKVLMEGKHLRLPDTPWPLAPDRGFVLVQDGPNYESKVLEARLLDLRTGKVLAVLRTLHRPAYHVLGVALGEAEVDGTLHEVLVHASDGQIVPLWPVEEGQERFVVINAGTGDAWVFEAQKNEDGAGGEPYPPYRYAYWGDLRKRPPEPKLEFALRLEDGDRSTPEGWLGPTWQDPAKAPRFLQVDSDDEECAKVELRPDGYKCVPFGTWAMAGGWRGKVEADRPLVMSNAEQSVAQVLELGEKCRIEEVTLDPPRAMLRCEDFDGRYLWSPEKIVRLPLSVVLGSEQWSRNRRVLEITRHTGPEDLPIGQSWIGLVDLRETYHQSAVSNETPYTMDRNVVLSDDDGLMVLDVSSGSARRYSTDRGDCVDFSSPAALLPLFAYRCRGANDSVRWIEILDFEHKYSYRAPLFREAWLVGEDPALIAVLVDRVTSRVSRWSLE